MKIWVAKGYIVCDSMYAMALERQNDGDKKNEHGTESEYKGDRVFLGEGTTLGLGYDNSYIKLNV